MGYYIILLQSSVCLFWMLLIALRSPKTTALRLLLAIMLLAFVSFLGDACFLAQRPDPALMVGLDAANQFLSPCIAPLIVMFVLARYKRPIWEWSMMPWLMFPIVMGMSSLVLYFIIGFEDSMLIMHCIGQRQPLPPRLDNFVTEVHLFVENILFYVMVAAQMLFVIGYLLHRIYRSGTTWAQLKEFLAGRASLSTNVVLMILIATYLVVIVLRCAFAPSYHSHEWVAVTMSILTIILLSLQCNVALNVSSAQMKIKALGGEIQVVNMQPFSELQITRIQREQTLREAEAAIAQNAEKISMSTEEYKQLLNKFNRFFVENKAYLRMDITINHLVRHLGYNRSYISYLINREYKMPFRDLVGQLRVEHAMEYMKAHPNCLQESAAAASGFTCASAFNRKFTQITGMTPRLWQVKNGYV